MQVRVGRGQAKRRDSQSEWASYRYARAAHPQQGAAPPPSAPTPARAEDGRTCTSPHKCIFGAVTQKCEFRFRQR
eukprot:4399104-Pleurochrysis_carterae.AAC.2